MGVFFLSLTSRKKDKKYICSFLPLDNHVLLNYKQVLETARQVASLPVSSTPIPYDQVTNQCEALVTGKQQKMSVLHSFKLQQEGKAIVLSHEDEKTLPNLVRISSFYFLLPLFSCFRTYEDKDIGSSLQPLSIEGFAEKREERIIVPPQPIWIKCFGVKCTEKY